jgi:hypothetical protein
MNEWVWDRIHEAFVRSTVPSQNMHGWGSYSETYSFPCASNDSEERGYIRRGNVRSEIYKDVGNNLMPSTPEVT